VAITSPQLWEFPPQWNLTFARTEGQSSARSAKAELKDDEDQITLQQFLLIFRERRLLPVYGVIVIKMFMVGILFGFHRCIFTASVTRRLNRAAW
jgi:hypothetical protein